MENAIAAWDFGQWGAIGLLIMVLLGACIALWRENQIIRRARIAESQANMEKLLSVIQLHNQTQQQHLDSLHSLKEALLVLQERIR